MKNKWTSENRLRSSAPETTHSVLFSSLSFATWAVYLIFGCVPAVCACWRLFLLAASSLVPWLVLLFQNFSQSLVAGSDLLQTKSLPNKIRESSVIYFLQIMHFLRSPDLALALSLLMRPCSTLNFRSGNQVQYSVDGLLLVFWSVSGTYVTRY